MAVSRTSVETSRSASAASCPASAPRSLRPSTTSTSSCPHVPWRYLPSGLQYETPDHDPGKVDDEWIDQAWPPELGRQRHLLQLRYVDRLVGDLLDRLRATDTFDDTLLVVTADHGIAFQPGQPVRGLEADGYVEAIHPEVMWVPMFVKAPGQAERARRSTPTSRRSTWCRRSPTCSTSRCHGRPTAGRRSPTGPAARRRRSSRAGSTRSASTSAHGSRWTAADGWRGAPGPHRRHVPRRGARRRDRRRRPAIVAGGAAPGAGRHAGEPTCGAGECDRRDRVRSTGPASWASVARASGRLPVLLTGALDGAPDGGQTVLWSLDGRIAAVTPTYAEGDQAHAVAAMLPAPMVRDGANRPRALPARAGRPAGAGFAPVTLRVARAMYGPFTGQVVPFVLRFTPRSLPSRPPGRPPCVRSPISTPTPAA